MTSTTIQVGLLMLLGAAGLMLNTARRREIAGIDAAMDEGRPWRSEYAINHEYMPLLAGLSILTVAIGAAIVAS